MPTAGKSVSAQIIEPPLQQTTAHATLLFRVVMPELAESELLTSIRQHPAVTSVPATDATNLDIRIIDCRSSDRLHSIDHAASFPALVVIDPYEIHQQHTTVLQKLPSTHFEIITADEINSAMLQVRLQILDQRFKQKQSVNDVVSENAYSILRTVMSVSNDWLVVKSIDHKFLLASRHVCDTLGLTEDEIIGYDDLEIGTDPELVFGKPGTDWAGYWARDDAIMAHGNTEIIDPIVLSTDEPAIAHERTTKIPLKDGSGNPFALLVLVSAVMPDTNDHDDLVRYTNTEDRLPNTLSSSPAILEIQRQKEVLEQEKQASDEAFIAKNQFVAAASHDIRQPLHALGLFIHALEQQTNDQRTLAIMQKIKRCYGSISELLNSLLDISRLDANVISANHTHFTIAQLLNKLYDEQIEKAAGKSLQLNIFCDSSVVHCDEILLERILRNLIINAINHTVSGTVTLQAQRAGAKVQIQVSDTGPGIPKQEQDAIFLEHYRIGGDSMTEFGLGLAIVKRLCSLLNIELKLESTEGKGSRFKILVPLGEPAKLQSDTTPGTPSIESKPTILVVDDDPRVLNAVQTVLEQHDCNVTSAESETELINLITANHIEADLVLIDYRLRFDMTGVMAIELIRKALGYNIPAIVITGDTSADGLIEIKQSGLEVLHKPVVAETLLSAVNRIVAGQRQLQN